MKPSVMLLLLLLLLPLTALADCRRHSPEQFDGFVDRFTREKAFALARTLYPTYSLRHEYGHEDGKKVHSTVKTVISKEVDARTPPMDVFARENGLRLRTTRLSKGAASVSMDRPETDWLLSYHFARQGHCWYLHHIEDHSL